MKYLLISLVLFSCCSTKGTKDKAGNSPDSSAVNTSIDPAAGNTNKPDTVTSPSPPAGSVSTNKIALYFGSMCCGTIGDEFLKEWLIKFNQDEKTAITADRYSGCGKEGEYIIVIYKNGFNSSKEAKFNIGLEKLIDEEVKKRKAENSSIGSVELRQNPVVEEYTYCRLGSKKWL